MYVSLLIHPNQKEQTSFTVLNPIFQKFPKKSKIVWPSPMQKEQTSL